MDLPNELSFKDKCALVEALLACKCMETSQSRDQIIADLDPALKNRIDRKSNNQQDVDSLVRTCLQYPPGMDDLLEIVAYQESNSIPWQKLNLVRYEICIRSTYQRITPTLLEELKRLLKTPLAADLIGQCFRQSHNEFDLAPELELKDAYEAFLRLFDEGVLNALGFLDRIADHLKSPENAKLLRNRATAVARSLKLTADLEQQREQMIACKKAPVFLLIQLLPATTQSSYTLQAWGWKGGEDFQQLDPLDKPCSLSAVKEAVRKFIKDAEVKFGTPKIVVELIMPRHLFCADLSEWKIDVGDLKSFVSLPEVRPVVLRWLNRFLQRQNYSHWRENWQTMKEAFNGEGKLKLEWLACADVCTPEKLARQLLVTNCGVYLAFGFVPMEKQSPVDLLTASLNAGTSIAVWFRDLQEGELVTQSMVEDLLANTPLPDLPHHFHELRRKHMDDKFHLAHRLVLLYDNYDRVPDLLPTHAPTQV